MEFIITIIILGILPLTKLGTAGLRVDEDA